MCLTKCICNFYFPDLIALSKMSDTIDHPLRPQPNSEEESVEDQSSARRTASQVDSRTSEAIERSTKQDNGDSTNIDDDGEKIKDGQNGEPGTLCMNNEQAERSSKQSLQSEALHRDIDQSEMQPETRVTILTTNEQTGQKTSPSPPYNLRSNQNTSQTTLVRPRLMQLPMHCCVFYSYYAWTNLNLSKFYSIRY